jgi:hypothetical protein
MTGDIMRKFSHGNKLLGALLSIGVMSWFLWSALGTFTATQEIEGLPGGDIQRALDTTQK